MFGLVYCSWSSYLLLLFISLLIYNVAVFVYFQYIKSDNVEKMDELRSKKFND